MRLLAKIRRRSKMMDLSKEHAKEYLNVIGKKVRSPMGMGALIVGAGVVIGSVFGIRYFRKSRNVSSRATKLHKKEKSSPRVTTGNRLANTATMLASLSTVFGLVGRYLRR